MRALKQDPHICYLCGDYYCNLDTHHIFNGAYKRKSEEDGFLVDLCRNCHQRVHINAKERFKLKAKAQLYYEENIGTHEEFMDRYDTDYLAMYMDLKKKERR